MKFILGKKENMTEYFSPEGEVIPVTIVSAGPVVVTRVFEKGKDGYNAVQVGYGTQKKSDNTGAITISAGCQSTRTTPAQFR